MRIARVFAGLGLAARPGAGAVLAFLLPLRGQAWGIAAGATVTAIVMAALVATAPERIESPPPRIEKAFQPHFRVTLRAGHTEEVLAAVAPEARPLPFTRTEVWTGKPELNRIGWGPGFERCAATPSEADLRSLVPVVRRAVTAGGESCRPPRTTSRSASRGRSRARWGTGACTPAAFRRVRRSPRSPRR